MSAVTPLLDRYAFRDPDPGRAQFVLMMCVATWPIACASCLTARATESAAFVHESGEAVGYGICRPCIDAMRAHSVPRDAGLYAPYASGNPIAARVEVNLRTFNIETVEGASKEVPTAEGPAPAFKEELNNVLRLPQVPR